MLSEAVAYEVTRLLHDNITEGTGTAAYTGCAGQAGKTGTTDEYTDAWFAGYQPNLATAVWVGYPESNEISMTSVHGITVFGGTFPAEIWHSLYSNGGVPCEEFNPPAQPISWAPFFGQFTQAEPGRSRRCGARRRRRARRRRAAPRSAAMTPTPTRREPARNRRRCRRRCRTERKRRRRRANPPAAAGSRASTPGSPSASSGPASSPTSASSLAAPPLGARVVWATIVAPRHRLRAGAGPALPRRLQLPRLRPARRRPRPRPLRPPAGRGARRPRLRRRHLDRTDQRLRPAVHARDLPAGLAPGRRSRWRC